jgi:hypothetical protein
MTRIGVWMRATGLAMAGLTLVAMATVDGCAPRKYRDFAFRAEPVSGAWGTALLSGTPTDHEEGFEIVRGSPYGLTLHVRTGDTADKRLRVTSMSFVDAESGQLAQQVAPSVEAPFHVEEHPPGSLAIANFKNLDLGYRDHLVHVTMEIADGTAGTIHTVTFELKRAYDEYWLIPMTQG